MLLWFVKIYERNLKKLQVTTQRFDTLNLRYKFTAKNMTLNNIFAKPKGPVPKKQKSDAIYSIPCNDCNQEYIGQTKRQFETRLKEHQKAVSLSKKDNSALSDTRAKQITRLRGITLKLSPPIDDTIKDVVWKLGT